MNRLLVRAAPLALLLLASVSLAQAGSPPVPKSHVPPSVLLELRNLERNFDLALASDCAPERCFSKGCVYLSHSTVDLPRSGSLPGLGQAEGPGSVPVQEYLTEARCELTHEKSVPAKDVLALTRRLELRLSRGWLKVTVARQILEPISPSLKESPPAPEPRPPPVAPPPPPQPTPTPSWEGKVALRELWVALLPHFSWMIAVLLVTLAALALIWAARRLGRESVEERALVAQLSAGKLEANSEAARDSGPPVSASDATAPPEPGDAHFAREQQELWNRRIGEAELGEAGNAVVELLRDWLRAGELELLAKAIFLFGDRLTQAFSSDGELAVRKAELAELVRTVDERSLPSDAEFFRKLNQQAVSSSLLAQKDAGVYRSLREELGPPGALSLIESLPPRQGALLFALVPSEMQHELSGLMSPEVRVEVADRLLASNRISREDTAYLFAVLEAARAGQPLPPPPKPTGIAGRGRELDAAGALSILFSRIEAQRRSELFARALDRAGGAFPRWYEDILFGDMLLRLPDELRQDLLLEVDVRGLAGWSSVHEPAWQEAFVGRLAPAVQNAVRASMAFATRSDQLRLAQRGHNELVQALKRRLARGKIAFPELVA